MGWSASTALELQWFFAQLPKQSPVSGWGFIFSPSLSSPWGRQWEMAALLKESSWSFVLYIYRGYFLHPAYSEGFDSRIRRRLCDAERLSMSVYRKAVDLCCICEHICPAKHWAAQPSPWCVKFKPLKHIIFMLGRDFYKRIKTLLWCIMWKETLFLLK